VSVIDDIRAEKARNPKIGRIRLAKLFGVTETIARQALNQGYPPDKATPSRRRSLPRTTPTLAPPRQQRQPQGLTSDELQLKYDPRSRLQAALRSLRATMAANRFYEEAEVRRHCGVRKNEDPLWVELTDHPDFAKFSGYTQDNYRLWGLEASIEWAAEHLTDFRKAVE